MEINLICVKPKNRIGETERSRLWILRCVALTVLAVILQAAVIHKLSSKGIIDKLIPWDECALIYMGISNAFHIKLGFFWKKLFFAHSPLAIGSATIAAMIVPQSDTAPYAINIVYLIALFLFINKALRNHGLSSLLAFLLIVVTTPFIFVFTSHIKTDFHGGILFFMLLSYLFLDTGRDDDKAKMLWVPALLSILILMTKPMAFYLPVLLSAVFVLSAISQFLSDSKHSRARPIVQFHGVLVLITLLAYACLVIPNFKFFKTYIAYALGPLWAAEVPLKVKLLYYLPFVGGDGENDFWGKNYVSFVVVIVCFAVAVAKIDDKKRVLIRATAILAATLVAYLPIVLSPQIQWSFGAFFAGAVMALLFNMFCVVQRTFNQRVIANLIIIVASLYVFNLPTRKIQGFIPSDAKGLAEAETIVNDFVAKMNPNIIGNAPRPSVFFPFIGPIPYWDFGIRFYRQYRVLPSGLDQSITVDSSIIDGGLSAYNYVVMFGEGFKLLTSFESNRSLAANQKKIYDNWNLQELSKLPYAGADYKLYRVVSKK